MSQLVLLPMDDIQVFWRWPSHVEYVIPSLSPCIGWRGGQSLFLWKAVELNRIVPFGQWNDVCVSSCDRYTPMLSHRYEILEIRKALGGIIIIENHKPTPRPVSETLQYKVNSCIVLQGDAGALNPLCNRLETFPKRVLSHCIDPEDCCGIVNFCSMAMLECYLAFPLTARAS